MVTDIRSKFAIPVHAFELAEFVSIPVIRNKNNSNFIFLKLQNEKYLHIFLNNPCSYIFIGDVVGPQSMRESSVRHCIKEEVGQPEVQHFGGTGACWKWRSIKRNGPTVTIPIHLTLKCTSI